MYDKVMFPASPLVLSILSFILSFVLLFLPGMQLHRFPLGNAYSPNTLPLFIHIGLITLPLREFFSSLLYPSIRNIDYTLLSGCTLMIPSTVLVANFLAEPVYGILDPRVHSAHTEEG